MKSEHIRRAFLDFFKEKSHEEVASSSLVPEGDATLLFANAGMNQFKEVFTGQTQRKTSRATTSQKCVRAGGKHNDLENVGKTARHHTFFEMLGNFSFGDYFKKEAICFAWEFLTGVLKLDENKLWITIHDSDDEAEKLWAQNTSCPPSRIVRMGDKDNFWAMGETGPCGPCSEIHFDQGPEVGCRKKTCDLECDCDRYLEIWNLVFMQYEQKADGSRNPLPNPCIDTGMGLERLSAVVNGKKSNYDTDLFMPIIDKVASITGKTYAEGEEGISHRVIADHIKATTFLMSDGIFPSNEGRGYVLRRIMRRAIRHAWLLGHRKPLLVELMESVLDIYGEAYPDLVKKKKQIGKWVLEEEKGFLKKIDQGIHMFEQQKSNWKKKGLIPGDMAFKLYDTYGFPLDLTELMAEQDDLNVDMKGFETCMEEQRKRAREASMFKTGQLEGLHWTTLHEGEQEFTGYTKLTESSKILKTSRTASGQLLIVPEKCAFYGESGGQVGDVGTIVIKGNTLPVEDTQIIDGSRVLILGGDIPDEPDKDDLIEQKVDEEHRHKTRINHTCTHLLHKVLKEHLGDHAEQRGSWVGPSHLRFDFPHPEGVPKDVLKKIEADVNTLISRDLPLSTAHMSLDDAKSKGVTALFGEKYGDVVRVVTIDGCSDELCGGTHLSHTGQAQAFLIRSEASIASGVRRIEAITGSSAIQSLLQDRELLKSLSAQTQSQPDQISEKVEFLFGENQNLKKKTAHLQQKLVLADLNDKLANPEMAGEISFLAEALPDMEAADLRNAADEIRSRFENLCFCLASAKEGKVSLIVSFPKKLVQEHGLHAGKTIKELSGHIKGGGGGSAELAQAGGKDPSGLSQALTGFKNKISELS